MKASENKTTLVFVLTIRKGCAVDPPLHLRSRRKDIVLGEGGEGAAKTAARFVLIQAKFTFNALMPYYTYNIILYRNMPYARIGRTVCHMPIWSCAHMSVYYSGCMAETYSKPWQDSYHTIPYHMGMQSYAHMSYAHMTIWPYGHMPIYI